MSDPTRSVWLYYTSQRLLRWGLKLFFRLRITGAENVPATGPCLIAANHCSYLDPPIMGGGINHRIVHFMARDTLKSNWFARWFFPRVHVIAIDRTRGDVGALRKAIQCLREGHVMGVFPEGTRSPDGEMQAPKGGIGFLIAKAAVPVVPAYISGTHAAFPKGATRLKLAPVSITYGAPITPEEIAAFGSERDAYDKIAVHVMDRIRALKTPAAA